MPGNYSSLILIFFEVSGKARILSRTSVHIVVPNSNIYLEFITESPVGGPLIP